MVPGVEVKVGGSALPKDTRQTQNVATGFRHSNSFLTAANMHLAPGVGPQPLQRDQDASIADCGTKFGATIGAAGPCGGNRVGELAI